MEISPIKTEILKPGFDLLKTVEEKLSGLIINGDIILLSSKIVALAQGRVADLKKIKPSKKALTLHKSRFRTTDPRVIELILQESDFLFSGPIPTSLKNSIFTYAAGIDLSNAPEDHAILWPKNPGKMARFLRQKLCKKFRLKKFGVVICDSSCQPLRYGTIGLALGWAGFMGVEDLRGKKDIFGRKLRYTQRAVADNLASSALLVMGEADEKTPFVLIHHAQVKFTNRVQKKDEIFVRPEKCVWRGVYSKEFINNLENF